MIKTNTLFKKLFLSYALIILISFILFGLIFIYLFHKNLYIEFNETYNHYHSKVEQQLQLSEQFHWSIEEISSSLDSLLSHNQMSIFIYHSNGQDVYAPINTPIHQEHIEKDVVQVAMDGDTVSGGRSMNGHLSYLIASPLTLSGTETGVMVLIFHDLMHEYRQMIFMILITFSFIIGFAGIILWFISKRITAPLRDMNQIALNYAKGDFSQSVTIQSNDEIGQLGQTFNHMARELHDLEKTRKDFIANVSHDLRSPLTSIKGFLIALLDGTIPNQRREHYYLLMKDETERVIKLVNDTLDMSQLEAGQVKLHKDNYNITRQLQLLSVKLEPQLITKNMEIEIVPDSEEINVFADPLRIEQALINLLQNAIQHSKESSKIKIYLEVHEQHIQIKIQDQGVGISEDQIKHIWKRFYKTDKARTNKTGIGIGLAIVKSIMDLHETEIYVESRKGDGTTFTFHLPLSKYY